MPGKFPRRYTVEFDGFRRFTWRERLKILIGYNAIAQAKAVIDSRLGSCKAICFIALTKQVNAEGQEQQTYMKEEE